MRSARSTSSAPASTWRFSRYAGLFFDEFATDSAWLRESAVLQLPPSPDTRTLVLRGEIKPHPGARGSFPSLAVFLDGALVSRLRALRPGPFEQTIALGADSAARGARIELRLGGVALTNTLAWLGRVTGLGPLQRHRGQPRNRSLRIQSLATADGEPIYDFSARLAPYSMAFARRHTRLAVNVVGFHTADFGVGESARCMIRAADAAGLATAVVPLKLHTNSPRHDRTYAARLQDANPHPVNIIHLDAPVSCDVDHHHGPVFRADKYNIGYWAWELPEFPDAWVPNFAYFDEIWCPSEFVRAAIAMKSPLPVLAMPHAIGFARPTACAAELRAQFGLPPDAFLFLFLYDLNSYSERKNPRAVLEAFRLSGLAGQGAALVIKVQNAAANPTDFAELQAAVRDLPGTVLITGTLPREDIYRLEAACDCFVSLHRSEGYGIALAECMYLGKPVIATDWSGSTEFLHARNGCPVNYTLTTIQATRGPYTKGQIWAEPDTQHAADWMRRVCSDRAFAAAIGQAGRTTIETQFSAAAIGARYRQRLESIATF